MQPSPLNSSTQFYSSNPWQYQCWQNSKQKSVIIAFKKSNLCDGRLIITLVHPAKHFTIAQATVKKLIGKIINCNVSRTPKCY